MSELRVEDHMEIARDRAAIASYECGNDGNFFFFFFFRQKLQAIRQRSLISVEAARAVELVPSVSTSTASSLVHATNKLIFINSLQ